MKGPGRLKATPTGSDHHRISLSCTEKGDSTYAFRYRLVLRSNSWNSWTTGYVEERDLCYGATLEFFVYRLYGGADLASVRDSLDLY